MKKNILIEAINYLTIAFATLPLFSHIISVTFGGIVYVAIAYSLALAAFIFNYKVTKREERFAFYGLLFIFLFFIIYAIGTQIHKEQFRTLSVFVFTWTVGFNNFVMSLPLYIGVYAVFYKSQDEVRKKYFRFFFICLFYTMVITFIALLKDPEYIKSETAAVETSSMKIYAMLGAGSFGLIYSLSIIIPFLFYLFRKTKKIGFLLICILGCVEIVVSGFMIATIVLCINIFLCLIFGIKNKIERRVTVLIFLSVDIFFLFNLQIVGEFELFLSKHIDITNIRRRLSQIANVLLYKDYSGDAVSGRIAEYKKSLEGIQAHPFLGNVAIDDSFVESGHSTIMDAWAGFGIVAVLFLCISFFIFAIGPAKSEKQIHVKNIIYVMVFCFFLVALFNPILASPEILINLLIVLNLFVFYKRNMFFKDSSAKLNIKE